MNKLSVCATIISMIVIPSCHNSVDKEKQRGEIIALLQLERKAHFDRDVDFFIKDFPDSMISVNRGKVTIPTAEETRKRFASYLGRVRFIKWDDVAEPMIRFSDDYSLAYAVVQKQVILSYPDSTGNALLDTTDFAWTSIYRKIGNSWKMEANISTNK